VRERTIAAIKHGAVPFERIVAHICQQRSTAYTPIFQVMCSIDTNPRDPLRVGDLTIEPLELSDEAPRYDLAIVLQQNASIYRGAMKYDRALFDEATIERMVSHFISAVEVLLGDPAVPVSRSQLIDSAERHRLLVEWNATARPYPVERTLVNLFHESAAAWPNRVAVECDGTSLTYRELNDWANCVADELFAASVKMDEIVGITLDRSLELVVAILAVLKCGAAYLPIEARHPLDRRNWMLENAGVKLVIGTSGTSARHIQVEKKPHQQKAMRSPQVLPLEDSACYVIYTSGTSGSPKAVVVTHRAITNNLLWMNCEWPLTANDALLFKSSSGFDVSVKEIFWPLIAGAKLVIAPPGAPSDPELLSRIIRENRISVVHMVPTMLDFFLQHEATVDSKNLRIVMCGGEALTATLRERFHKLFGATLFHLYGPTEAAIAVTCYEISPQQHLERLPLGKPMPNCRIYVLDRFLQPVPIGVPGELCIAGIPLARGYVGNPDLTALKFVPDPFSATPGSRMYRTGDLGKWRSDGQLEYLGRIDRQIKLGGFRIEPAEVEAAIRAQTGVDDALVVVRENGLQKSLVAYVASQSPDISTSGIQQAIRAVLPAFMVPAQFIIVPAFPTNLNGKTDISALPPSDFLAPRWSPNPPHGELEAKIARIWCQVLNVERVGRDEDFFELGGHSLLILRLQAQMREDLGYTVSVANLLLNSTVASLAAHISESPVLKGTRWLKRIFETGRSSVS
jgi:amino acid adenylation domain-containing protein